MLARDRISPQTSFSLFRKMVSTGLVGRELRSFVQIFIHLHPPTDIDWEFPNIQENHPKDKQNYNSLLQTIKQTIGASYYLSVAIGPGAWRSGISYDIPSVFQAVDFVNLMSYDLHGDWEPKTGLHSGLYQSPSDPTGSNVDACVKFLLSQGVAKEKIIMGIPSYGHAWTLSNPNQNGVGAPASGAGTRKFKDLCQTVKSMTYVWDDDQKCPYAYSGSSWVGYDDVKSVTIKAQYINDNGLGGAMIWDIDSDDYSGACGLGKYPLISAINAIVKAQPESEAVDAPQSKVSMQMKLEIGKQSLGSDKLSSASAKFLYQISNGKFKSLITWAKIL
jgi:chitinase